VNARLIFSPPRRRRPSAQLTRLVTAHHEAGHCVMAIAVKGPWPKAVTIAPDPGDISLLGRSDIDLGFVDTRREGLALWLSLLYAQSAAVFPCS
jgi:hypothetical protein